MGNTKGIELLHADTVNTLRLVTQDSRCIHTSRGTYSVAGIL